MTRYFCFTKTPLYNENKRNLELTSLLVFIVFQFRCFRNSCFSFTFSHRFMFYVPYVFHYFGYAVLLSKLISNIRHVYKLSSITSYRMNLGLRYIKYFLQKFSSKVSSFFFLIRGILSIFYMILVHEIPFLLPCPRYSKYFLYDFSSRDSIFFLPRPRYSKYFL